MGRPIETKDHVVSDVSKVVLEQSIASTDLLLLEHDVGCVVPRFLQLFLLGDLLRFLVLINNSGDPFMAIRSFREIIVRKFGRFSDNAERTSLPPVLIRRRLIRRIIRGELDAVHL